MTYSLQGSMIGRADKNGPQGCGYNEEVCFTLNTRDRHGVVYDARGNGNGKICPTLTGDHENRVTDYTAIYAENLPPWIVRRLTPTECGRLQGFPDGWGDIERLGEYMPDNDAAFWHGVYLLDCEIKGKKPRKSITQTRAGLAKWYNALHTDSAEYKMWGNGMALPNALFVVRRAVAVVHNTFEDHDVRLGSLFDGSGTMPLCAEMCGARAVWASEVEPYPIAVTRTHLPHMKHYGDVAKMRGDEIEPVDILTFGSPCQDMSIAGNRAGLDGSRSSLFYHAIRIAKEMLAATDGKCPRFLIWENVTGALSSNGGKDFESVLNELLSVTREPRRVKLRRKWSNAAGYGAVAYRVFDAQYWGIPQRRRRVYAVADTRGGRADELLFEQAGAEWHFDPRIPERETVARLAPDCYQWHDRMVGAADGVNEPQGVAYTLKIRSGCDGGGKGALVQKGLSATLATHQDQTLFVRRPTDED